MEKGNKECSWMGYLEKKKTIWVFHYANALVILLRCLGSFHDKRK
jgi:hypothetical protein